jgi:LPXTG-motif cell wall-anchored protein
MNRKTRSTPVLLTLAAGMICLAFALSLSAQVQTETNTASQTPSSTTKTVGGTIVYVNGNDLILKMDDGTLKHISNVSPTQTATVDGKEITIKDAKVGMHLTKTITTTTTPKIITTTQSVTGTVWQVSPPNSVILTLDDGKNQQFKIPKGQKFNVDGQETDAWGLRKGMKISATRVVEAPETVVTQQAQISGTMPPPPPPPPPDQPILVAVVVPVPAAAPEAAPAALPKTGSSLPLIGLLGFLSLAASFGVRAIRGIS